MKTGLFAWFCETLSCVFGPVETRFPTEFLKKIGAPEYLLEWVETVEDEEFELKTVGSGWVPDLESRQKTRKRQKGQYYTPENFSALMLGKLSLTIEGNVLDPSCGDGSFLLAVVRYKNDPRLDTIYGIDVDAQALLVCLGRLLSEFPFTGWPVLRHGDFLACEFNQKFSLIIGNPPYKVNLSKNLIKQLKRNFKTAEGEKDLYTFFLERSTDLLADDGELILLTSHTWLVNYHCRLIRDYIFSWQVKNLFLLPSRFFVKAPGVLPVVTHLKKRAEAENLVTIHSGYDGSGWNKKVKTACSALKDAKGLRQAFLPDEIKECFELIEQKHATVGEMCRVGVGIQESLKREEGAVSKFVCDSNLGSNYRPVLKGREIRPYRINWEKRYINYGSHLAYAGDEKLFAQPKILYQNIRNEKLKIRLVAAYDAEGFFPKNSLSFVVPLNGSISFKYLLAVLNSALINAWFSGHYHSFHITVSQVKTIPLAVPSLKLQIKIGRLIDRMLTLPQDSVEEKKIKKQLDYLVGEAYALEVDYEKLLDSCDIFLEQAARL